MDIETIKTLKERLECLSTVNNCTKCGFPNRHSICAKGVAKVCLEILKEDSKTAIIERESIEPNTKLSSNGFKYDFCGYCDRLLPVAQDFEKAYFCPYCGRKVKLDED